MSVDKLIQLTSGYSYKDIQNLLKELLIKASKCPLCEDNIIDVLRRFRPRSYIGYSIQCSSGDDNNNR